MELTSFVFEDQDIRTTVIENEPYFIGKDVAEVLGYSNTRDALIRHVDREDKADVVIHDGRQNRNVNAINESGLYALIFGSKLETARRFKRWVTSEVLPTIRRHGVYAVDEMLDNPDVLISALERLKIEREQRLIAEQQVNELKPKASYYDTILQNKSTVSVTKIAKDYGKSAIWLNRKLHELGVRFKQGNTWLLYQKYAEKGYTHSHTYAVDADRNRMLTKWTQAGRIFIYELLKDEGILPLIEREDE